MAGAEVGVGQPSLDPAPAGHGRCLPPGRKADQHRRHERRGRRARPASAASIPKTGSATRNPGWRRGLRVGSARTGEVLYFIPDPAGEQARGTSAAEGVAVDAAGNIYGAEVGPRALKKYVRQ